ncbi:hypothetical protein RJ641_023670 [Dillenia turbinata]|uniref:Desiccation-related protein PCC13-62 n=1 Tax=Dillenia turbinata TaxID=194707 RepID=A0AAN8UJC8_9MAGN
MGVLPTSYSLTILIFLLSSNNIYHATSDPLCEAPIPEHAIPIYKEDIDLLQFALNLEHLEADYFLWGALGYGLDDIAPELVMGGPPPIGVKKANLDALTMSIIHEFGLEEVGHLRVIKSTVGGFPRPLMDLSAKNFATLIDEAFGKHLEPPFDPYHDSLKYMIASYVIPYMGLVGYVGANPLINGFVSKRLLAGLLGVESGQDAVIRMYLYERREEIVEPYNYTVAEFTIQISNLRNSLAKCGIKDEGIIVPYWLGAENKTETNVLSADFNSLSYTRTPGEILRVLYNTGDEHKPGGFYPEGGDGRIAREFLHKPN